MSQKDAAMIANNKLTDDKEVTDHNNTPSKG